MKQRYAVLDVMKGVAIFLVVMGHVLTMCIREIDRASLFKFIGEIHMPLFFFVSGFLALRRGGDGKVRRPELLRRALRLLLPMIAVSSLWVLWFPSSGLESPLQPGFGGLWGDEWKNGYWFTPVLYEITLVFVPAALILSRVRNLWGQIAAMLGLWVVLALLVGLLPDRWVAATSLGLAVRFFPAFIAGAIAADRREAFMAFCSRSSTQTAAILLTALLLGYVCYYWRYPFIPSSFTGPCRSLLHVSLAIVAVGVMNPWAQTGSGAVRLWSLLGRKSLAIYLLHYFLLFPLGAIRPALESMDLAIVPLAVVAAAVAACIIGGVLIIDYIIGFSSPLALVLTGAAAAKK